METAAIGGCRPPAAAARPVRALLYSDCMPGRVHERDLLCVCGLAAVEALFASDAARVERLFFEPRLARALATPRRLLAKTHKPYREVEADELARIAGTIRHGGVVAVARPKPLLALDPGLAAGWARDGRPLR